MCLLFSLAENHQEIAPAFLTSARYKAKLIYYPCVSVPLSSVNRGQYYRTINPVNTSFNNPILKDATTVKIVDPTHPLFGQSFRVAEWKNSPGNAGFVFVEYRHSTRLYIPVDATNLGFVPPTSATKLTCESIHAFINLGMEVQSLCRKLQSTSGKTYQTNSKEKS